MPELETSVLRAAQMGAGWAFERIYGLLAPAVHGYLRVQGIDDPEGAVNDVLFRAFRRIESFEGDPTQFRSWIFTIAHHLVVDRRRFASRRPAEVVLDRLPEVSVESAESTVLGRVGMHRLRAQLDLLTPEQRDVLLLRFVADLSIEEVAAAQGRSAGSVKALQHRALETVRRRLAELEEFRAQAVSPAVQSTLTGA